MTGGFEDDNVTNIVKLHLLFGGDFEKNANEELNQISLYYSGVGTYGEKKNRIFNTLFAPERKDVGRIINEACCDLERHFEDGDSIFLFGFSRGAAIARRFAVHIDKKMKRSYPVAFMGVFDTVASIGMPDLSVEKRPASDVVFENRTMSKNVDQALHLCSIDDKRKAFQPTLLNREGRVTEMWFAGAHSDVGGGYRRDGLSDLTLRYMLTELRRRNLGIRTIHVADIKYRELSSQIDHLHLGLEDIIMKPDCFGKNHRQSRPWPLRWTLYDRKVVVISDDKIMENEKPLIHHSVAERIYGDDIYRPAGLKNRAHIVCYEDGSSKEFNSLGHHLQVGMRTLTPLKTGEERTVYVDAFNYYNRTGLLLEKGSCYSFKVEPEQTWWDAQIECDAGGWSRSTVKEGLKEIAFQAMEPFRRKPDANWFELIGAVGDSDEELFTISASLPGYTPQKSGEFCPFANDLKRMYNNNDGEILLHVKRIS